MALDIFILIVILTLILLGAYDGFSIQILNVAALIIAFIFAPFVASELQKLTSTPIASISPLTEAFSWVGAGILIYVVLTVVGRTAVRLLRASSTTLSVTDRVGGGLLGLLKGIAVVYVICVVAIMIELPLKRADENNSLQLREGRATQFFKEKKIFLPWQLPDLPKFNTMIAIGEEAKKRAFAQKLREKYPEAADFLRTEEVQNLLKDKELVDAAKSNNWAVTMADPKIRELLSDRGFERKFNKIEWYDIEKKLLN